MQLRHESVGDPFGDQRLEGGQFGAFLLAHDSPKHQGFGQYRVLGARPELAFGLTWPQQEFDGVWNLALSGHLKFARVYFTKPHYNSGLVVSASFATELEQ